MGVTESLLFSVGTFLVTFGGTLLAVVVMIGKAVNTYIQTLLQPLQRDVQELRLAVQKICPVEALQDKTAIAINKHKEECSRRTSEALIAAIESHEKSYHKDNA